MFFFNCSTNVVGGAVQNAVNFIKELSVLDDFKNWGFVLSKEVYSQISYIVDGSVVLVIDSPAKNVLHRKSIEKFLNKNSARILYTSAGPAYIKVKCFHIMGCSNPYILGSNNYALKLIGKRGDYFKRFLNTLYQRYYIKKSNAWIVQTDYSKLQLKEIVNSSKIYVVDNTLSKSFSTNDFKNPKNINVMKDIRCLIPSAYYKHKDLERIPLIATKLSENYPRLRFYFTLSDNDFQKIYQIAVENDVGSMFLNLGSYDHSQALDIYINSDIILQPSALEVFSTSYLEAISVSLPLVSPRLPFSEDICGDYAYYYDINCNDSYSNAIISAIAHKGFNDKLNLRRSILDKYSDHKVRTQKILNIIKEVLNER